MAKTLVTGASGFIAQQLIVDLLEQGGEERILDQGIEVAGHEHRSIGAGDHFELVGE